MRLTTGMLCFLLGKRRIGPQPREYILACAGGGGGMRAADAAAAAAVSAAAAVAAAAVAINALGARRV